MKKKEQKVEIGDLVRINGIWKGQVGIVCADDTFGYVITDHFEVANCIVDRQDIQIIKKGVIDKKYRKYLTKGMRK